MKTAKLFVVIFLSVALYSCEDEELSTVVSTETRELAPFEKLELQGIGSAELIPSEEFKIEIITHVDLLHDVKTKVSDNKLYVELRGRHRNIKRLDYKIYAPFYTEIELDAVGDIYCYDGFEVDHLAVLQNDVGKIVLRNLSVNTLYAELDDVGDIVLTGTADEVSLRQDGVGNIEAFDLEARVGEAILDGVGDIEIFATEDLTIRLDGIGKVYYKGDPDLHLHGKGGNVVHRD